MDPETPHADDNQPPEFAPRDLWADDIALREAVAREGGGAFVDRLAAYGALAGDELYALSFDAHRDRPRLRTHDRFGQRIDLVEFHPNYHRDHAGRDRARRRRAVVVAAAARRARRARGAELPASPGRAGQQLPADDDPRRGAGAAARAGAARMGRQGRSRRTTTRATSPIAHKRGVTIGMGMTEKQGGSDVRANTTRATPLGGATANTRWSATSGSSPRRCPTASWCWRRRRRA